MIIDLHNAIVAICPIVGIKIPDKTNRVTWSIDFTSSATPAQKTAAQAILASFDINAPSQDEADATIAKADAAIVALKAMTPAQAKAWVVTNVNTLADAKSLLGTIAAALCILARRL